MIKLKAPVGGRERSRWGGGGRVTGRGVGGSAHDWITNSEGNKIYCYTNLYVASLIRSLGSTDPYETEAIIISLVMSPLPSLPPSTHMYHPSPQWWEEWGGPIRLQGDHCNHTSLQAPPHSYARTHHYQLLMRVSRSLRRPEFRPTKLPTLPRICFRTSSGMTGLSLSRLLVIQERKSSWRRRRPLTYLGLGEVGREGGGGGGGR